MIQDMWLYLFENERFYDFRDEMRGSMILAMKQLFSGKKPMYLLQSGAQTVFENIQ